MFESPVLIYSNYCNYSKKFIALLKENPEIGKNFVSVNIDVDPRTRQRPDVFYAIQQELNFKIAQVPTIIVEEGQYVLSGEEAFKWLEYEIQSNSPADLTAFNPNEMGSFSDNYSPYGEKDMNNASEQTFCFVNKSYDGIPTPPEDAVPRVSQEDFNKKQKMRENIKMTGAPRMGHSDTYTRSKTSARNNGNSKQQEMDSRLEQLMMERDQMNRTAPPPKNIDFTTGRVM